MKPRSLLRLLTLLALPASLLAQGELDPPGAPAPTMKSLDQVEPRTDIAEVDGDDSALHVIDSPGSYYLSSNIGFIATGDIDRFIEIRASGVTLDLMGFNLSPSALFGGDAEFNAILIASDDLTNITIRNGHINGPGIATGISGGLLGGENNPKNVRVSRVSVADCSDHGISILGRTNSVEHCSVTRTGRKGVRAGQISHTTATDCDTTAIEADGDVSHSTGISNGAGSNSRGIEADGDVLHSTGISGGDFPSNYNYGIFANGNVEGSTGESENGHGILSDLNVTDSFGKSENGTGISTDDGTVSHSRGVSNDGGVGISCSIAIGCTTVGGELIDDKFQMP